MKRNNSLLVPGSSLGSHFHTSFSASRDLGPRDLLRLCKAFRQSHLLCLVRQERLRQCLESFTATGLKVKGVSHEELMNLGFTDTAYFLNTLGGLSPKSPGVHAKCKHLINAAQPMSMGSICSYPELRLPTPNCTRPVGIMVP